MPGPRSHPTFAPPALARASHSPATAPDVSRALHTLHPQAMSPSTNPTKMHPTSKTSGCLVSRGPSGCRGCSGFLFQGYCGAIVGLGLLDSSGFCVSGPWVLHWHSLRGARPDALYSGSDDDSRRAQNVCSSRPGRLSGASCWLYNS